MAYDTLKTEIRQYIKTNGANEITGQILQNVLLDMVNAYPSLDGYATQTWVQNQLSDMATMTWVGQNFVQNSALNDYLPLTGGVMTGGIIAGDLSTGMYSLHNTGLILSYSYNGSTRYARKIDISSVDSTITFTSRGGASTGTVITGGNITSGAFIVDGGTSAQFLKADGSVDSNTYLTSSAISDMATQTWVGQQGFLTSSSLSGYATETWVGNNYLPLSGGVMTGGITAGDLSTGMYSLHNTGLVLSYSYNGSTQYARKIDISSVDSTITFTSRGGASTGTVITGGNITSGAFIVDGGTSAQFLKADGSVDSNTYLTSSAISDMATQTWVGQQGFLTSVPSGYATETWVGNNYLPLTGGTLTGDLNIAYSSKLNFGTSYIYQSTIPGPQGTNMGHILNFYGVDGNGYYDFDNSVHATSFVKSGGTSAQFLKADGSVDSNTYLTSVPSGYATETWVGNNYLPLTGGAITGNLSVNGELDTFSRMQVNGTSADKPFIRLHIPNVNWARLQMDTDGVIHVMDGSHGTSYNGFACGNLDVNGTLKIAPNKSLSFGTSLEIFKVSTTGMLVMKNDEHDIVLGSIGNNFYVSFIEDIQGGTANSDYSMNTVNWGITTAGAATFVSVSQTSDIRRKNIISDIGMDIDDIAKAPVFRFTMKDDDEAIVRIGTSAQYWKTVIPELVSEDKRGVLGLQYDVAALAGVITVAKRVVDHEARIAELEKENALLKAKLNIN